ncbi:MAG: NUDIX domain-containing protein [Candidatus Paceibacterota bacterium]
MDEQNKPKVGVGVLILKEGKILFGKRKGSHGEGEYAFPGGHLEYMESFEDCAKREVMEECGINIKDVRFQFLANVITYAPKHYVHIGVIAQWESGEAEVLEMEKSESWNWYPLEELPSPMFKMCELAIKSYKDGQNYYDVNEVL